MTTKRYAKIEDGVVTQILLYEDGHQPEDLIEVVEAEVGYLYDGETFTPPVIEKTYTAKNVNWERDRRIAQGTTITVSGPVSVYVTGRPVDQTSLQGLATTAQLLIAQGAGDTITKYRDGHDVIHDLNQHQILEMWVQAMTYVSDVFAASWLIKDDPEGITADYKDDTRWPPYST